MARRLLPLTRREFGRHTPREVREMCDGALWRAARDDDRAAWQMALLMNATGNYKERITVRQLLGREPVPPDPLGPRRRAIAEAGEDGRPDWDEATRQAKSERAALVFAMAQAQKGMTEEPA